MTSWLQVLGRIGRDFTIEQYETRNKPIDALGLQNGYYSNNLARNVGDNYDFTMTAKKDEILDSKLDLTFSMGTSRYNTENYYIGGRSGTWYYPNMYTFFNYTDNIYSTDLTLSFINYHRLNSPMLGEDWNSFSKGLLYSWPRSYQAVDKMNYANPDGTQNPQDGYPFLYLSKTIWWDYYNNNTTQLS